MTRTARRGIWYWLVPGALAALLAGGYGWHWLSHWRPDPARFPDQGVEVGEGDGPIDWPGVRAIGGRFAYLDATSGGSGRDPAFTRNLEAARGQGLRVGAVHRYDPCQPADRQAANFVTLVPRDAALLPPAVQLDALADGCPDGRGEGAIESELTTFLNQIETHTGKPAVLQLSAHLAPNYGSERIGRPVWLVEAVLEPRISGRPWALWTANPALISDIAERPLRWVVARR